MRKLVLLALALAGFGLAACNTVRGFGEDIQHVGRSLERASDRHR